MQMARFLVIYWSTKTRHVLFFKSFYILVLTDSLASQNKKPL